MSKSNQTNSISSGLLCPVTAQFKGLSPAYTAAAPVIFSPLLQISNVRNLQLVFYHVTDTQQQMLGRRVTEPAAVVK